MRQAAVRLPCAVWICLLFGCFDVPTLPEGDPRPGDCVDCDNGEFCDGLEHCEDGVCLQGERPCPLDQVCDEVANVCRGTDMLTEDGGALPDAAIDAGSPPCIGDCMPCQNTADCGVPQVCQKYECIDNICKSSATIDAPCDDGDPCFVNDGCDSDGVCQAGNTPKCDGLDMCVDGECIQPPECQNDEDCEDRERPLCSGGSCVQCRAPQDCQLTASPVCRGGECICENNADCTALDAGQCTFADVCAETGSIQRGRCIGRQCEARQESGFCARETNGNPCDDLDGTCQNGQCQSVIATINVNCRQDEVRMRVFCNGIEMLDRVCGREQPPALTCPRGTQLTACCSSDLANECMIPPPPGSETPFDVVLTIQPALSPVRCSGPVDGTHRQCVGTIGDDPTVSCRRR